MLKKPYNLIASKDHNNYYYLDLQDPQLSFLAIESVENLDETVYRRFRKPKTTVVELTQSLKLLPLTSLTLFYMASFLEIPKVGEFTEGVEKQDIYNTWDEYDIGDLRKVYMEIVQKAGGKDSWKSPYTIKNNVARALDKDSWSFIGVENSGSITRDYWLIKTTKHGHLGFAIVHEVGIKDKTTTPSIETFILDRGLCHKIVTDFGMRDFTHIEDTEADEKESQD